MSRVFTSVIRVTDSKLLLQAVRFRSHKKAAPLNIKFKQRKQLYDEQNQEYRSRLADAEIEAKEVMRKSREFSSEDRITVPEDTKSHIINGVPEEHKSGRMARIYIPTKPSTQSGTHGTTFWQIEFDNRERWENSLMGWSSTADPLSNLSMKFPTAEKAQEFCEEQGWPSYVDKPNKMFLKPKSYGANFSWDKRTRRGTK